MFHEGKPLSIYLLNYIGNTSIYQEYSGFKEAISSLNLSITKKRTCAQICFTGFHFPALNNFGIAIFLNVSAKKMAAPGTITISHS